MNHESSGERHLENVEETEWDGVGREVAFNEERYQTASFVEDKYGKSIESIVENACFDGGDKNDRENYVISLVLGEVMSDEEQWRMIDTYIKTGKIHDAFGIKIRALLSKKIAGASQEFTEEIHADPYLRNRRTDELAGRPTEELNDDEESLRRLIYGADKDFYESNEARSLFSDRDYVERTYEVALRNHVTPNDENETAEAAHERAIKNFYIAINTVIDSGAASVEELIKDPYLRKQHFDSLMSDDKKDMSTADYVVRDMWRFDDDFYSSFEYESMLRDKSYDNPEIYRSVNEEEVNRLTNEALEKISLKDYKEILKAYEKDIKRGDALVFEKLLPILGLDKNRPTLQYGESNKNDFGFYQRYKNSVIICDSEIKRVLDERNNADNNAAQRKTILDIFKKKKLSDEVFCRINTIAHETWHAHQWVGEGVDEDRRKQYRENFAYYMHIRGRYDDYRAQLIESEAWEFGGKVETAFRTAYKNIRGEK